MVIRESIEIYREEIKLLRSAGYKVYSESDDYVCFYQTTTVVDSDLIVNKKSLHEST